MRVASSSSALRRFRIPLRTTLFSFDEVGSSRSSRCLSQLSGTKPDPTIAWRSFASSFFFSTACRARFCAPSRGSVAFSYTATPTRSLSTLQLEDEDAAWERAMGERYGPGNYQLFRSLYKDLCDEMRNEFGTKPPPPLPSVVSRKKAPSEASQSNFNSHSHEDDGKGGAPLRERASVNPPPPPSFPERGEESRVSIEAKPTPEGKGGGSLDTSRTEAPSILYGDGSWSASYDRENNFATFTRDAIEETRQARVVAYAPVEVKDPPKLNAMLTFVDWFPIEVLITRKGVILHFSIACNEGGMHMRNVRAYDAAASPLLMESTDNARWVRENLFYDGPCLWHLEMDFQNELYDTMQDHGVDLDWVRWVARWVFYFEHVSYTRWSLGMLEELIPSEARGPEEDFLLEKERAALEEPVEESLSGRGL